MLLGYPTLAHINRSCSFFVRMAMKSVKLVPLCVRGMLLTCLTLVHINRSYSSSRWLVVRSVRPIPRCARGMLLGCLISVHINRSYSSFKWLTMMSVELVPYIWGDFVGLSHITWDRKLLLFTRVTSCSEAPTSDSS